MDVVALAPVAGMLSKLGPRLSTNHDGEVVATVRAIERTLKGAGLDFHALAHAVGAEPETKVVVIYKDRPTPTPESWCDLARWCSSRASALAEKERTFVRDMAWLRAIYAKLKKGAT